MRTVVIIDDDLDDVEFFKGAVMDFDPNTVCYTYNDCEEALDGLRAGAYIPDVIFLDINMPKMTGDVCLDSIRNILGLTSVRIAMVSTSMENGAKRKLLDAGADFALWKPYRVAEYATLVALVLSEVT